MVRMSFQFLLIACLLACPFRCWSHSAVSSNDNAAEQVVVCQCCNNFDSGSELDEFLVELLNDGCPIDGCPIDGCPADCCDCSNCICNGAVPQRESVELDLTVGNSCLFMVPIEVHPKINLKTNCLRKIVPRHSVCFLHGRSARIAHQSLLI